MKKLLFTSLAITVISCVTHDSAFASLPVTVEENTELWAGHHYTQITEARRFGDVDLTAHGYMGPIDKALLDPSNISSGYQYPKAVLILNYAQTRGSRINGGQAVVPLVMHFSPQYDEKLPDPIKAKISQLPRENVKVMCCFQNYPWTEEAVVGLRPHNVIFQNTPREGAFEKQADVEVAVFGMPAGSRLANTEHNPFVRTRIGVRGDEFEVKPTDDPLRFVNPGSNTSFWSYVGFTNDAGQPQAIATLHCIVSDDQRYSSQNLGREFRDFNSEEFYFAHYQQLFQSQVIPTDRWGDKDYQMEGALRHMRRAKTIFLTNLSTSSFDDNFKNSPHMRNLADVFGVTQPVAILDTPWQLEEQVEGEGYWKQHKLVSTFPIKALIKQYPSTAMIRFINVTTNQHGLDVHTGLAHRAHDPLRFDEEHTSHTLEYAFGQRNLGDEDKFCFTRRFVEGKPFEIKFDRVELVLPLHTHSTMPFRFGLEGDAAPLPDSVVMTGFADKEQGHRWVDGHKATLQFPGVDGKNYLRSVTFDVSGNCPTEDDIQNVHVTFGGKTEDFVCAYGQGTKIKVEIPYITDSALITFDIPDAKLVHGDGRTLGLLFKSATLEFLNPIEINDDR